MPENPVCNGSKQKLSWNWSEEPKPARLVRSIQNALRGRIISALLFFYCGGMRFACGGNAADTAASTGEIRLIYNRSVRTFV